MSHDIDLDALIRTRDAVVGHFAQSPTVLERSYAAGKWTGRLLLLHLADTEQVLLDRAKRILAEEKPLLLGFAEDRWQSQLFPESRNLDLAKTLFVACRSSLIEIARLAGPDARRLVGVHSEVGRRSFAQVVNMAHAHVAHHLGQLDALAAGRTWTPIAATYAGSEP